MNKNDNAWKQLFEKYHILEEIDKNGSFEITAQQIRDFREPRLMTKFDHTINLPTLFGKNELSILPITRKSYIISHFKTYHEFESPDSSIERVSLPPYLQSLDIHDIKSETIALNCAMATGIIADFTEDEELIPTVSGRMGSGKFDFDIQDTKYHTARHICVENAQIEIDAAYEGVKYLSLFEAKCDLSKDFLVRQIYYPYRVWKDRMTKTVKTIFLVYSNGIYRLFEYRFQNSDEYSSLILVKQKNYSIEDTTLTIGDIQSILQNVKIVEEPENIPFPQADTFSRVINLCELLQQKNMTKDDVTEKYDFDGRQTDYYINAARYLNLSQKSKEKSETIFCLSDFGKKILNLNYKQRQLAYCKCILSHRVFHEVMNLYFSSGEMPDIPTIMSIMKKLNVHGIGSKETFKRRAATVSSWIEWIVSLADE